MRNENQERDTAGWTAITVAALIALAPAAMALSPAPDAELPLALGLLNGTELWNARYDGGANGWDTANAVAVHPHGLIVYVTGESTAPGTGADIATAAYEATTGLVLWTARYDGPAGQRDAGFDVSVHPDGGTVYVTGTSRGTSGTGIATIAYDALTGVALWEDHYAGTGVGPEQKTALTVSANGTRLYVTGATGSWSTGRYTTMAYDTATGDRLWLREWMGASGGDEPQDIVISPDGARVYVTGWTHISDFLHFEYATVAYDTATGDQAWVARYDGPDGTYDFARAVAVDPSGGLVLVTGGSVGIGTNFDLATIAYDATSGAQVWVARYDGPRSSSDSGYDVAISPDGATAYVTGFSWGLASGIDYVTIAYDTTTGAEKWTQRFNGAANATDLASALALSADGMRLFVTGYALRGSGFDYGTVAYDAATGDEVWIAYHAGIAGGGDFATDIAVDPHGLRVYVTGGSQGTASGRDYATVAHLDVR